MKLNALPQSVARAKLKAGHTVYRVLVMADSLDAPCKASIEVRMLSGRKRQDDVGFFFETKEKEYFNFTFVRDCLGHSASVRAFRSFRAAVRFRDAINRMDFSYPFVTEAVKDAQDDFARQVFVRTIRPVIKDILVHGSSTLRVTHGHHGVTFTPFTP